MKNLPQTRIRKVIVGTETTYWPEVWVNWFGVSVVYYWKRILCPDTFSYYTTDLHFAKIAINKYLSDWRKKNKEVEEVIINYP